MKTFALITGGAAALLAAAPAAAITTFATFGPSSSTPNISFDGSLSGAGAISSAAAPVSFSFLNADGTTASSYDAVLNLAATTDTASTYMGIAVLPISSGLISFTSASAITYGGRTGTNLLTVSFNGGYLTGLLNGSTANYGNSTPPNDVTFTSDFLDFSSSTARDLALAINGINPSLGFAFGASRFHTGTVSGNFGADVFSGSPQGVPEPASWAMMLCGFGLAGSVLRTQRRRTEVTFG